MLPKKSNKADLEKNRGIFFKTGLVITLSLSLFAFNRGSKPDQETVVRYYNEKIFEPEIPVTVQRVEQKINQPKVIEIFEIVPNDKDIPDIPIDFIPKWENDFKWNEFPEEPDEIEDEVPWVDVQDMPLFNGGKPEIEFVKYISKNLVYPQKPAENGVKGRVLVQFVVNSKGKISDATVLIPVDPELDKEALRVINSSPLWTPGKQRGKAVKVIYTFPINFVLQ